MQIEIWKQISLAWKWEMASLVLSKSNQIFGFSNYS